MGKKAPFTVSTVVILIFKNCLYHPKIKNTCEHSEVEAACRKKVSNQLNIQNIRKSALLKNKVHRDLVNNSEINETKNPHVLI